MYEAKKNLKRIRLKHALAHIRMRTLALAHAHAPTYNDYNFTSFITASRHPQSYTIFHLLYHCIHPKLSIQYGHPTQPAYSPVPLLPYNPLPTNRLYISFRTAYVFTVYMHACTSIPTVLYGVADVKKWIPPPRHVEGE